jgi:CBS domain-containing protein
MRVRDCAVKAPLVLNAATSLSVAGRLVALHDVRHAAVAERGQLVGTVSKRAIGAAHPSAATSLAVAEVSGRMGRVAVADVMDRDPLVVSPATPLAEAVRLMRDPRVRVLVVCDQDRVVGLLTADELLCTLGRLTPPEKRG